MVIGIDYWNRGSRQTSTSVTKIYVCSPDHPVLMINLIAFTPLTRKWLKTGGRTVVPFCNTVLHLIHHNLDTSSRHIAGKSYCGHFFFYRRTFFFVGVQSSGRHCCSSPELCDTVHGVNTTQHEGAHAAFVHTTSNTHALHQLHCICSQKLYAVQARTRLLLSNCCSETRT